eukprot:3796658-Alexandrium_andersonii.AAC.1
MVVGRAGRLKGLSWPAAAAVPAFAGLVVAGCVARLASHTQGRQKGGLRKINSVDIGSPLSRLTIVPKRSS